MSSEQRVDPQLIEQTKQQIRTQVNEIAQLAKSDISPGEFYAEFLPRLVSSLAAVGGVVWTLTEQGQLAVAYQINYQESGLARKTREDQIRHLMLLHKAVKEGEGALVQPRSGFGSDPESGPSSTDGAGTDSDSPAAANPTDWLLVLGPLKTELENVGIVEIFQRADAGVSTQKGYLRFLLQMCELAGDFLRTRQLRNFSDRQTLWTRLEEFSRLIHASLDPRETAYIVANEGRRLIECDRVSIALKRGKRCVIEAVSGQDMVDKRSNTVRMLGELATVVVQAGEPVWYHGDTKDLAPQIEEKLQEYVDESHTKAMAVLPLQRTLPPPDPEKERLNDDEIPAPFGAIIVEQIEDSRIPMTMVQRIDVVRGHSVTAIANAMEHTNLFLMPVWRTLGKSKVLTTARYLPKTLLVCAAVLVVLGALIFVPKDFKLHSTGSLKPEVRQDVFAGIDGNVDTVVVQHGQHVGRGQLLLTLNNYELGGQTEKVRGEHDSIVRQIEGLRNQLTLKRTADEQMEIHNQIHELTARQDALAKEYQVLVKEWELLQVCSPIEGEVMTWDVGNKLKARPVQQGAFLMQVADPKGPWELELQVPEDRMGCIAREQMAHNAVAKQRLLEAAESDALAKATGVFSTELTSIQERIAAIHASEPIATDEKATAAGMTAVDNTATAENTATTENTATADGAVNSEVATDAAKTPTVTEAILAVLERRQTQVEKMRTLIDEIAAASGEARKTLVERIPDSLVYDMMLAQFGEGNFEDPRLDVEFVLATEPSQVHHGRVVELHDYAEIVEEEQGVTVQVRVAFDQTELNPEQIRQGATVSAKIHCGRASIGYCWFYDLVSWTKKTWFRWFY